MNKFAVCPYCNDKAGVSMKQPFWYWNNKPLKSAIVSVDCHCPICKKDFNALAELSFYKSKKVKQ